MGFSPCYPYPGEEKTQGLKSLRENSDLQLQPRRGDLKVAQDAVLGCVQGEISSPGGTAESMLTRFSRPSPGFPVELGGFGKLHAPFLTERRTRGPRPAMRGRKSGSGTNHGCDLFPGLASWATFRSPLRGWSCKSEFSRRLFSPCYLPALTGQGEKPI